MGQGYYHKALFLNVPHQGTPLADITVTLREIMKNPLVYGPKSVTALGILSGRAAMIGGASNFRTVFNQLIAGAIDDMTVGSDAVSNLQTFTVPTHGHVGTGGSDLWFTPRLLEAALQSDTAAFIGMVFSLTSLPEALVYATSVHDVAVLLDSQIGGLSWNS
jgi:hypothetical protein